MFQSDNPIQNSSQDLLNRGDFASSLAKSLISYKDKNSLCVGLVGPWGSGKTSLVNLILNDIEEISKYLSEEDSPVILRFNPWNFMSSDQLMQQFFTMLADEFAGKRDADISQIGDAINEYGSMLEIVPDVGMAASKGSHFFGNMIKSRTLHGASISAKRKKITDLLDQRKNKVIISIDDIDRLNSLEIQLIFKLVASVANFPNTIFLLSFDKNIVVHALDNYQEKDGKKYLEKIIQVFIDIPPASDSQLREIFDSTFIPLIQDYSLIVFDPGYWNIISIHVFPLLDNIRDISRLFNNFQLKLEMIGNEINFSDLIMTSVLELKKPRFFEWIRNHKSLVVYDSDLFPEALLRGDTSADEMKKKIRKELADAELSMDIDECMNILLVMFPAFTDRINGGTFYDSEKARQMIRDQRIGHADKFDRYFIFSLGERQIPRSLIINSMEKFSPDKLEIFINNAVQEYEPGNVIDEIEAFSSGLDQTRSEILLTAMLKSVTCFRIIRNESSVSSAEGRAEYLCVSLMEKIGKDSSFDIMKSFICTAGINDLEEIASLLDIMLISHDVIRKNSGYPIVVTKEQLNELGKTYIRKIHEIDKHENLLSLDDLQCIWIIQYFDETEFHQFIHNKVRESDLNKLLLYASTISSPRGSDGIYFHFHGYSGRDQFLSDSELDEAINKCVKDRSINLLPEEQALKIAAYFLHKSAADQESIIPEKDCYSVLKSWGYTKAG